MQDIRRKQIADMVNVAGSARISEIASRFDVSEMTVHRDLDYLDACGLLQKKRGGAIANDFSEMFTARSAKNVEQKQVIAQKAFDLIDEHDVIAMDGSTSSIALAQQMKHGKKLTVITNSILILSELEAADNIELYSVGNMYSHKMNHFIGNDIEERLANMNFSKCFFGVAGVSPDLALFEPYPVMASIKLRMIRQSLCAYALADSSKFGAYSVQKICDAQDIKNIITDDALDEAYREKLVNAFGVCI